MASIRRTLFTNVERQAFLGPLVVGCVNVLRRGRDSGNLLYGDPAAFHEFCRLLSRMKATFQLGELLAVPQYAEFIQLIADFTSHTLMVSPHTLISTWGVNFIQLDR